MTNANHSMNDFDTLTAAERELFDDQGIENAFQTWAASQVTLGFTLGLRRRFIDRTRELFNQIEAERKVDHINVLGPSRGERLAGA